jgi:hypothetical protein
MEANESVENGYRPEEPAPLAPLVGFFRNNPFEPPQPPSRAERLARLIRQRDALQKDLGIATESAKTDVGSRFHQYVEDRFYWLHVDFFHENSELEHANAVAWILQEALVLRRAATVWDALRRYRLGARSDIVAALWRRRADGRLWLFDQVSAPLKPSHRILVFLTELHLQDLVNAHVWNIKPEARMLQVPHAESLTIKEMDFRKSRAVIRFRPRTPLSAAWLQLFDDLLNDRASSRICQECGTVFDPTRTDQVFCGSKCSNRHHQRAYRLRTKRSTSTRRRTAKP